MIGLCGAVALLGLLLVPHFFLPSEDVVILFQYSRNLAQHGTISYVAGGPRAEGATDFLWMVLVGGAMRLGIPAFLFCQVANVLSLMGLGVLLLRLARVRATAWRVLVVVGAAAMLPQIFAAVLGFAMLPDALLLVALVCCVLERRVAGAALTALVFCLFRPDGVVFAVPLLLWMLLSGRKLGKDAAVVGGLYVLPGVLYFLWRWHYFGEFFPLPFLVKSDAQRVLGVVVATSAHESRPYLLFVMMVLAALLWPGTLAKENRRQTLWLTLLLVVVPTAFFWTMRLDQNVAKRFFYYLPVAVAILLAVNWPALAGKRRQLLWVTGWAWMLLLLLPWVREYFIFRYSQFVGIAKIAQDLGRVPQRGRMMTTEAGLLPYLSGWQAYDAWGLNSAEFAHRLIQPGDVERLRPDLLILHPDRPEGCLVGSDWPQAGYMGRTWVHMTRNLVLGASRGGYELWLISYGSESYRKSMGWRYGEGDRECWFVRKDSPVYGEMVGALRENHGVEPEEALRLEETHDGLKLK
ncbi:hypothetical protein FTO74_04440 [Granulicella sp. WH15]|uniref:hypothetical protein n=1 Tax=Granulicella sp. WH15 TaxID=2602070 RepID=UPI0013678D60|nr:hypothetical protein [Granulicella sp. WH15]QHN02702.1 hypothetical protein FTO74_04440 [Granulicella sp. WH15]